ncbi:MAG: hypothetical protein ABSH41_09950 [Syntrophobacteraceae bacterium]
MTGYFSKFAGIAKRRQSSVENARANKQVRTKLVRIIVIPDNVTDIPLCLPVQTTGANAFKPALYNISRALQGVDART